MPTVVERVARVIAAYEGYDLDGLKSYSGAGQSAARAEYEALLKRARTVIAAMRGPTVSMVEAGTEARWHSPVRNADNVREIWDAMIGVALSEDQEGEDNG